MGLMHRPPFVGCGREASGEQDSFVFAEAWDFSQKSFRALPFFFHLPKAIHLLWGSQRTERVTIGYGGIKVFTPPHYFTMEARLLFTRIVSRLASLGAALALASCASKQTTDFSLAPVPYAMRVPEKIAPRLSTGPIEGPFRREVEKAGARAATTIYFHPKDKNLPRSIFLTAYSFPASKFDAAQNPNEPPRFGMQIVRADGMVLSIAGPHDTIYDPHTPSGQEIIALNKIIYESQSYHRLP